jgi:membrane protein DedA with SNARE-associated domain
VGRRGRGALMVQDLANALERFLTEYGYFAVFLLMLIEEAGVPLPLPNEVALMYVGYLSSQGRLDPNLAGLAATAGAAVGSTILYTLALRGGRPLIQRFGRFIHVTDARIDQAERWVERYGMISIPIARLTPGLRIATTIVAGVLRVPYRVVFVSVVLVSLVWSFFWIHLGRALGDRWEEAAHTFDRAGRIGLLVVVAVVAIVLLGRWLLQRRQTGRLAANAERDTEAAANAEDETEASEEVAEEVGGPRAGG